MGDNDNDETIAVEGDNKKHYNQPQGSRRGGEERYGSGEGDRTRAAGWGGEAAIVIKLQGVHSGMMIAACEAVDDTHGQGRRVAIVAPPYPATPYASVSGMFYCRRQEEEEEEGLNKRRMLEGCQGSKNNSWIN